MGHRARLSQEVLGEIAMPITKRPCSNCPFRKDGSGIELQPGRIKGILLRLLKDDGNTFVCHKTLESGRMTCAGAVGVMSKLERLPFIARLGLAMGVITQSDVKISETMVIDPPPFTGKQLNPVFRRKKI